VRVRPNLLKGERIPKGPRQKRSLEKHVKLKAAGLALFGEKGYEGTSVGAIARRANLAVGTFYQHFHSKRQLLLTLMDELLTKLSQLDLRLAGNADVRKGLRALLSRAFSHDLRYLGAYRAWQEAVLSEPALSRKQQEIHEWTVGRAATLFAVLQSLPGARKNVDISGLARAMDSFFWTLLRQAAQLPKARLNQSIDAATHLIYHALFTDPTPRGGD
jgi:AcrR family transcriptional regulator